MNSPQSAGQNHLRAIKPFDREDLTKRLSCLDTRALVAFATSCTERLYEFYEAFCINEEVGNPSILRAAIDFAWGYAERGVYENSAYDAAFAALTDAMSAERVYESVYAPAASDACHAVRFSLRLIKEGLTEHAVSASLLLQDSLDGYLALVNMPRYSQMSLDTYQVVSRLEYLSELPLFLTELEKQQFDIDVLEMEGCTPVSIAKVRHSGAMGVCPVQRFSMRARGQIR